MKNPAFLAVTNVGLLTIFLEVTHSSGLHSMTLKRVKSVIQDFLTFE